MGFYGNAGFEIGFKGALRGVVTAHQHIFIIDNKQLGMQARAFAGKGGLEVLGFERFYDKLIVLEVVA